MSLEPTYTPLNGSEIKKAVKMQQIALIEKIPYLKEGNAYKQAEIMFEFQMKAYPADCPVPAGEWQLLIGLKAGDDVEFDKDRLKLQMLEEKRNLLLEQVNQINNFLNKHIHIFDEVVTIKDNGIPDEVRIAHGLPVPMISTSPTGKKNEISVPASGILKGA